METNAPGCASSRCRSSATSPLFSQAQNWAPVSHYDVQPVIDIYTNVEGH